MIDNDEDGDIDLDDKECISPCDDNENSFQTDLPGQNNDCKSDCYFDSNSGKRRPPCGPDATPRTRRRIGCEYDQRHGAKP
jgi:hypothetical protein